MYYFNATLGGDWSVALAVFSRSHRESVRKELPGVIFIVLSLSNEALLKRVKARMGKVELSIDDLEGTMKKLNNLYEPAGDDEENTYNLLINEEMSPEDVVQKVIDIVQ